MMLYFINSDGKFNLTCSPVKQAARKPASKSEIPGLFLVIAIIGDFGQTKVQY